MSTFIAKVKRIGRILRGFIPRPLPVGVSEFNLWVDRFIDTYPMPSNKRRDISYTLASMLLHSGNVVAYRSDWSFFLAIRSAASKQVAGNVFQIIQQELKAEQAVAQQAQLEASKPKAEAPAPSAASDGSKV